jgi:hypothetical protein
MRLQLEDPVVVFGTKNRRDNKKPHAVIGMGRNEFV